MALLKSGADSLRARTSFIFSSPSGVKVQALVGVRSVLLSCGLGHVWLWRGVPRTPAFAPMQGDWAYPALTNLWEAWRGHHSQQHLIPCSRLDKTLAFSAAKECANPLKVSYGITYTPKPWQLGYGLSASLFLNWHPFFVPLN